MTMTNIKFDILVEACGMSEQHARKLREATVKEYGVPYQWPHSDDRHRPSNTFVPAELYGFKVINEGDIHMLSPGDGFKWSEKELVVGKKIINNTGKDEIIYSNNLQDI